MDNNIETEEIWRDVEGYEKLYEVSSLGRIRSCDKIINCKGGTRMIKGKVLSQRRGMNGYLTIMLHKNHKPTGFSAHRLVGMAFQDICGEYVNGLEIDHKNCIRTDNRATNLRWATKKENHNNPLTLQHYSDAHKGEKCYLYGKFGKQHHGSKPILQFDLKGNFIAEFDGLRDAERKLGIFHSSIGKVLKGMYSHTHGYIFRYKEETQN